ncbi:MAG: TonB family protein [Sphingobacteriales bacterium]|nr:TonB family protein [Sphingobacteriales bacterium]
MESLHYLVLVNLYLLLFYGFYHLLLRNETFFRLNRIYLVGSALMSFIIPFIQLEWIKSLFITSKVQEFTFVYSMIGTPTSTRLQQTQVTTGDILAVIYLIGLAVFSIRFIVQLISIQIDFNKRNTGEAFSFFKQIKVDSNLANHDVIMKHEQVHAKQLHSADVILFELIAIMNWFNPVVYFYKKAIKNLHEFTADEVAAFYADSKNNYSMILLSNAFGVEPHQLTNSFFNKSLLKQRIYMLNKTKSKKAAILKYGLSVPLFAGMLILSSATVKEKVEASEQIAKLEPQNLKEVVSTIPEVISKKFSSSVASQPVSTMNTLIDTTEKVQDFVRKNYNLPIALKLEVDGRETGINIKSQNPNAIYVLNGKEVEKEVFNSLDPKSIESINVLKDKSATNKYGDKGKNGVIEIATKTDLNLKQSGETKYLADDSVVFIKQTNEVRLYGNPQIDLNLQNPNVLYIINGKEADKDVAQALKPSVIKSMNVLKDKSAIDKYGEKGKSGVIEITTKTASDNSSTQVNIQSTNKNKNIDFKGMVFINGKEKDNSNGDALKSLKPEDIKSMNVIKSEDAIKKYGEKGKNGVIEITLKKE